VVVLDGRVVARAHNLTRTRRDRTAHAELIALQSRRAKRWARCAYRVATVYTTVEPCFMCAGALVARARERARRVGPCAIPSSAVARRWATCSAIRGP
jgi:tRNA(Arg) A34 adenosine deaminase TadA